jgi:hypothetical protein
MGSQQSKWQKFIQTEMEDILIAPYCAEADKICRFETFFRGNFNLGNYQPFFKPICSVVDLNSFF